MVRALSTRGRTTYHLLHRLGQDGLLGAIHRKTHDVYTDPTRCRVPNARARARARDRRRRRSVHTEQDDLRVVRNVERECAVQSWVRLCVARDEGGSARACSLEVRVPDRDTHKIGLAVRRVSNLGQRIARLARGSLGLLLVFALAEPEREQPPNEASCAWASAVSARSCIVDARRMARRTEGVGAVVETRDAGAGGGVEVREKGGECLGRDGFGFGGPGVRLCARHKGAGETGGERRDSKRTASSGSKCGMSTTKSCILGCCLYKAMQNAHPSQRSHQHLYSALLHAYSQSNTNEKEGNTSSRLSAPYGSSIPPRPATRPRPPRVPTQHTPPPGRDRGIQRSAGRVDENGTRGAAGFALSDKREKKGPNDTLGMGAVEVVLRPVFTPGCGGVIGAAGRKYWMIN